MQRQPSLFIFKKEYETIIFELAKGEGSTMTFAQTVATIYDKTVTAKPSEISLVKNLKRGLDYVLDLLESEQMVFSKRNLCAINSLVAFDDNHDNLFALDNFEELLHKFNNQLPTNENIIKLALMLCKYQFFGDGNKRTAQLMMNGLLVQNGLTPFVLNFKEEENIEALIQYYDEDNVTPLYDICLKHQAIIEQAYQIPS